MSPAPVIAVVHGAGPLPILGDPSQHELIHSLSTKIPPLLKMDTLSAPKAIILVTAHWETEKVTISNGATHPLFYDYHGFPLEAYSMKYDAAGSPEVADAVAAALMAAGIPSVMDPKRGWDHGVFVPLLLIHPAATIPIVQISVLRSQSPADLYAVGQALAPLRKHNIAIIGSGSASFHNIHKIFSGETATASFQRLQSDWSAQLDEAVEESDEAIRLERLRGWKEWEGSSLMHPVGRTEHFSPLVVCAGAAGEGMAKGWYDEMMGTRLRTYYWE